MNMFIDSRTFTGNKIKESGIKEKGVFLYKKSVKYRHYREESHLASLMLITNTLHSQNDISRCLR